MDGCATDGVGGTQAGCGVALEVVGLPSLVTTAGWVGAGADDSEFHCGVVTGAGSVAAGPLVPFEPLTVPLARLGAAASNAGAGVATTGVGVPLIAALMLA